MSKGRLLFGLDIGSSSVKLCRLKDVRDGYSLVCFDMMELPDDAIVDGTIMDMTSVTGVIKQLLTRNKIRQKDCAIAVSGNSVIVKRIRLSNMTDEELEANLQWEVEKNITFDYRDVTVDTVVLKRMPEIGSMDLLLVAAKNQTIEEYMMVAREAGLRVRVVDVSCFALQNMHDVCYGGCGENETIMILDVGSNAVTMSVMAGGMTVFTRDMSIGGKHVTEEIQRVLGITRLEAEEYKKGEVSDEQAQMHAREVENAVRAVSEGIAQEIRRSLEFFVETTGSAGINRSFICGGVSRSDICVQTIESITGLTMEVMNPFKALDLGKRDRSELEQYGPIACVAVGLALRRVTES